MNNKKILYLDRNENQYGPSPACLKEFATTDIKELSELFPRFYDGI